MPAATDASRVEVRVGRAVLERLLGTKSALVAKLGRANPRELEATRDAFGDPRRIGGHPIASNERMLGAKETRQLARAITDPESYLNVRRRCLPKTWVGARFGAAGSSERIEVVLARTCDSLLFVWSKAGETKSWGGIVTAAVATSFEKLVLAPPETKPLGSREGL